MQQREGNTESCNRDFQRVFWLKMFGFGLYDGIKFIWSGLYGGNRLKFILILLVYFKIVKNYFKIVGQI